MSYCSIRHISSLCLISLTISPPPPFFFLRQAIIKSAVWLGFVDVEVDDTTTLPLRLVQSARVAISIKNTRMKNALDLTKVLLCMRLFHLKQVTMSLLPNTGVI